MRAEDLGPGLRRLVTGIKFTSIFIETGSLDPLDDLQLFGNQPSASTLLRKKSSTL